jgi:signal transduction histidine kinase
MDRARPSSRRVGAGRRDALSVRWRSLRAQILLWTILPIAIFILGLSFVDVYGHQLEMRAMVEERNLVLAQAAAGRIAEGLQSNARLLQAVGANPHFRQAGPADQERLLVPLGDVFRGGLVVWVGEQGTHAATHAALPWSHAPFVAPLARTVIARGGPAFLAAPEGGLTTPDLAVAVPLPGPEEGALVGLMPLSRSAIAAGFASLQGSPQAEAHMLDGQGRTIYRAGPGAGLEEAMHRPTRRGGEEGVVTTAVPVPGTDWQIVLSEPWHGLVPLVLRYAQATVLIAAAAVLISLLAVYMGVRYVTSPLQTLGQRARRMAWGDFDAVAGPVGAVEEIADLQRALQQMAAQVRGYQAVMRSYVAAVTQAQEEERLRLARELHDDTVQSLIALGQQLERAQKALAQAPESGAAQLAELRQTTRGLVQDVRRLIGDLRPACLDELGLVVALEMLVRTVPATHQVDLESAGQARRLAPDLEIAIYRIVQAALKNVEQHSGALYVAVRLGFEAQGVRVVVEDDGAGFEAPDTPDELAREGHFGLLGMRERAMLFGGWLSLTSQPGQGTRVEAFLPTAAAEGPQPMAGA